MNSNGVLTPELTEALSSGFKLEIGNKEHIYIVEKLLFIEREKKKLKHNRSTPLLERLKFQEISLAKIINKL